MNATDKKPWEKYTPEIAESDGSKPWEQYAPAAEKKSDVQNGSGIGTPTSKSGFAPFQSPVDTKTPSVLTPKGKAEYQEQVKDYAPAKEVKPPKDETPDFFESVKNSVSNIGTGVQQFIPNTQIALSGTLEGLLGKDLGSDFYRNIVGAANNPELDRQEAYAKLAELEPQFKKTRGLIESAENFDVVGLAAATVDAMSSLVRTAITSIPTAGIGLASDMVGGSIASYNQEKAKSKGISVDELYKRGENEFVVPATIGAIGTGLEGIGLKGTIGLINKKLTGSLAKKFATAFVDVNKEGLTEFTQTGLDAANNALSQGKSATEATKIAVDEMFSKKGLESYLMGAVGSAGAAGLGRVAKGMLPANKAKVEKDVEDIVRMTEEVNNPNASPATQAFVAEQIKKKVSDVASTIDEDIESVEKFGAEQKQAIEDVQNRIAEMDEMIAESSVGESTSQIMIEERDKLVKELETILKEKPKPTKEPVVAEALTKAETDLEALKQVTDKVRKYEASLKRLTDAKNAGTITENEFNDMKSRFDDVMGSSAPAVPTQESAVELFKVGDKDTFYHASPKKREGRLKPGSAPQFGEGIYFSTNRDLVVDEFGNEVTEVKLNVKKPLYTGSNEEQKVKELAAENWNRNNLTYDPENEWYVDKEGNEAVPVEPGDLGEKLPVKYYSDAAKQLGYDVIVDEGSTTYDNEIVVLDESKIQYQDAIQEQTTNEIPLQPETAVSAEVAEGVPGAGLEVVADQSETIPEGQGEIARSGVGGDTEIPSYGKTVDTKIGKVDLVIEPNTESENKNSIKVSAYDVDGNTLGFSSAVIDSGNKTLTIKVSQIKDKYQRNGIYSKIIDEYEIIAKDKGLKLKRDVDGETQAPKNFWDNRELTTAPESSPLSQAFDLIESAKRTKKTEKGKMEAGELAITNLGDVGKKAIFIDNNFKDIVSRIRTLKDQKGEPFVKIDCS